MDKPDTIAVNIELEQKVYASRADMYVEIKGDSFFSGNAALEKALEVRDLVAVLAAVPIEESHIQVVGITAEVSSGIIATSSSAVYRLRIEVASLDINCLQRYHRHVIIGRLSPPNRSRFAGYTGRRSGSGHE